MNISEMRIGEEYIVVGTYANLHLERRLFGIGIREGANIKLLQKSYLNKNYLIEIDGIVYAIKKELASKVLIKEK